MGYLPGFWRLTNFIAILVAGLILDSWGVRRSFFTGELVDLAGTFVAGAFFLVSL